MVVYNGEINILCGNVNWMVVCQVLVFFVFLGDDIFKFWLIFYEGQLDIVCFDNVFEFLVMGGYLLVYVVMMLIFEVWVGNLLMDDNWCVFYEYYVLLMELWDGLVVVVFMDGWQIGVMLDWNGLCFVCYIVIDDNYVIMFLEVGVLLVEEEWIVQKWCLQLGKMLFIDLEKGGIIFDDEIKWELLIVNFYKDWLYCFQIVLEDLLLVCELVLVMGESLFDCQQVFGYMQEDIKLLMMLMVIIGQEVIGLMGMDILIFVLFDKVKFFYIYFKQNFVQVINLLIDLICEELVMSLVLFIGLCLNIFDLKG